MLSVQNSKENFTKIPITIEQPSDRKKWTITKQKSPSKCIYTEESLPVLTEENIMESMDQEIIDKNKKLLQCQLQNASPRGLLT